MRLPLQVSMADPDETLEATADARDFRRWEEWARTQRPPLPVKPDSGDMPVTIWLTRLAYTACKREQLLPDGMSWADFDARCTGVEQPAGEPDTSDEIPTQAAVSAA